MFRPPCYMGRNWQELTASGAIATAVRRRLSDCYDNVDVGVAIAVADPFAGVERTRIGTTAGSEPAIPRQQFSDAISKPDHEKSGTASIR